MLVLMAGEDSPVSQLHVRLAFLKKRCKILEYKCALTKNKQIKDRKKGKLLAATRKFWTRSHVGLLTMQGNLPAPHNAQKSQDTLKWNYQNSLCNSILISEACPEPEGSCWKYAISKRYVAQEVDQVLLVMSVCDCPSRPTHASLCEVAWSHQGVMAPAVLFAQCVSSRACNVAGLPCWDTEHIWAGQSNSGQSWV